MKKGAFSQGGLPKVFMDRFGQHVTGFISGFDRLRFRATLRPLFQPGGLEIYLYSCMYFPRKNGHVILGFFGVLSNESGDSVPRTPWDFSLWACSGGDRPWAGGPPVGGRTRRLQGCIGARVASPQSSILRCSIDSLG